MDWLEGECDVFHEVGVAAFVLMMMEGDGVVLLLGTVLLYGEEADFFEENTFVGFGDCENDGDVAGPGDATECVDDGSGAVDVIGVADHAADVVDDNEVGIKLAEGGDDFDDVVAETIYALGVEIGIGIVSAIDDGLDVAVGLVGFSNGACDVEDFGTGICGFHADDVGAEG